MWPTSLNNLAALYETQGQYAKAEPLYQRALAIREKALGPEHPDVAASLNNLAVLYHAQGQYAKAEPLYQRALAIREKALGPEHPDVATSLNNLAVLYRRPGPVREGRAALPAGPGHPREGARARASRHRHEPQQPGGALPGPGPVREGRAAPSSARSPSGRRRSGPSIRDWHKPQQPGGALRAQGQYAKAEPLYQRALPIREATLTSDHPHLAQTMENYAALLGKLDRDDESEGVAGEGGRRTRTTRGD